MKAFVRRITPEQYQDILDAQQGLVRFNPNKFREVVLATPGVSPAMCQMVIDKVMLDAICDDGSIDVLKSGICMGELMKEHDSPEIVKIAAWVNNLDRLPIYKVTPK